MRKELGIDRIIKKIIIAVLFVLLFNFAFANLGNNIVFADEKEAGSVMSDEEMVEEEGVGELLLPVHKMVLILADAVLQLMQNNFISSQPVTITATAEEMEEVNGWAIAGIVIGAVVLVAACVVTCRSCRCNCWGGKCWNCSCCFRCSYIWRNCCWRSSCSPEPRRVL